MTPIIKYKNYKIQNFYSNKKISIKSYAIRYDGSVFIEIEASWKLFCAANWHEIVHMLKILFVQFVRWQRSLGVSIGKLREPQEPIGSRWKIRYLPGPTVPVDFRERSRRPLLGGLRFDSSKIRKVYRKCRTDFSHRYAAVPFGMISAFNSRIHLYYYFI